MNGARAVLGVAGGVLVLSALALVLVGAQTQAEIGDLLYRVDSAGVRIDRFIVEDSTSVAIARAHAEFRDLQLDLTAVALVAIAVAMVALRRIGRERELKLVAIALPPVAILVTSLVIACFGHYDYDDQMVHIHRRLSSVPAEFGSDGLCSVWIERCSRLRVYDTMRTIAFVLTGLAVLGLAWSGRLAWRAGQRGHGVGRVGQGLSLACFVLGLLALLATRGHRSAREQVGAACEAAPTLWTDWAKQRWRWASVELEPVVVESCAFELWTPLVFGEAGEQVFELELFATDALVEFPRRHPPDAEWAESETDAAIEEIERALRLHAGRYWNRGPAPLAVVTLYVDARVSGEQLAGHLDRLAAVGVRDLLVIGEHFDERELETVGVWRERALCPIARLRVAGEPALGSAGRLDWRVAGVRALGSYATMAELIDEAIAAGPAGLELDQIPHR